jgi:hypothetical protein
MSPRQYVAKQPLGPQYARDGKGDPIYPLVITLIVVLVYLLARQ